MILISQISPVQTQSVRHKVLWPHRPSVESCTIDIDNRADAIHLGAFLNNEIVGVCSLFEMTRAELQAQSPYRLRAMGTLPYMRGLGAGRLIVEHATDLLTKKGHDLLWCDARIVAKDFYSKLGFKVHGEAYEIPIIGTHYLMYKELG